jgi:hypothetical protein
MSTRRIVRASLAQGKHARQLSLIVPAMGAYSRDGNDGQ